MSDVIAAALDSVRDDLLLARLAAESGDLSTLAERLETAGDRLSLLVVELGCAA